MWYREAQDESREGAFYHPDSGEMGGIEMIGKLARESEKIARQELSEFGKVDADKVMHDILDKVVRRIKDHCTALDGKEVARKIERRFRGDLAGKFRTTMRRFRDVQIYGTPEEKKAIQDKVEGVVG